MSQTHSPFLEALPDAELTYGRVVIEDGHWVIHDGEPCVREAAKRLFPGCVTRRSEPGLRFYANKRSTGDLNWLMMRYPLVIEAEFQARYDALLGKAREHDVRRKSLVTLKPIQQPKQFNGTLKPFQSEGAAYLLANEKTILGDDMGLGKTVTALAAMASLGRIPAVVICPKNVAQQWCDQAERFLPGIQVHRLLGITPSPLPPAELYVLNYDLLRHWRNELRALDAQLVVFDEVQELRKTDSQKYSAASFLSSECECVWGLSGTPIYNKGLEIWAVTNALDFNCLGSQEAFTREWCSGYGSDTVSQPDVLHDHLKREGLLLRRRKSEVLSQLPPKHSVTIDLDHDHDKYTELIGKAAAAAQRYETAKTFHDRGQAMREVEEESRKAIGIAKAPYVAEFVRQLVEKGHRPLVFAHHHAVHDLLTESLWDLGLAKITGKQTDKQKRDAALNFQNGAVKVLQMALRSSAGIDGLQQQATCVVFAELDWSPAIHGQCEDRVHRLGLPEGLDGVWCYYLVAEGSYDQVVQHVLGLKIQQFKGLMGDATIDTKQLEAQIKQAKEHLRRLLIEQQPKPSETDQETTR